MSASGEMPRLVGMRSADMRRAEIPPATAATHTTNRDSTTPRDADVALQELTELPERGDHVLVPNALHFRPLAGRLELLEPIPQNTWPLVFSFLRHTWAARVPPDADPRTGPVRLKSITTDQGQSGRNWDLKQGGYQTLEVASFAEFTGDRSSASWLINAAFVRDWQTFEARGSIR
jgi:hypothetical protein